MSEQYPGGYISKSPPVPTATSAPGLWNLSQQAGYRKQGLWPTSPGAPTIGVATVTSSTAVSVAFTAPADAGSAAITSYTVTSSPGGITASGASSPISVTGLTAGTAYTFTVTATNGAGTGPASAASSSVTTWTVPDAPTIGTATATSATTATVTYTAPAFNGGTAITSYTAVSSPGGITGTLSTSGSGTITVSGLSGSTSYTFTVYATNSVGNSASSAASNSITTPAAFPTFSLAQSITNPAGINGTWFGWDIDVDDTASKLLISAVEQTSGANPKGAVFYYTRSGSTFSHGGTVYGTTSHTYQFGRGVNISKDGSMYGVSSSGNRQYLYTWPNTQTATTTGTFEEATFAWTASSPTSIVWTQDSSTATAVRSLDASGGTGSITLSNSVGYLIKNIKSHSPARIAFMGYNASANCNIYNINASTGGLTYNSVVTTGNGIAFTSGACPAISGDGNYLFVGYTSGGTGYLQVFVWNGSTYAYQSTASISSRSRFGISVVTNYDGTVVAVGDDQSTTRQVFIYERSGGSATLKQTINAPAGVNAARFGYTMAMNQNSGASTTYLVVADAFTTNSGVSSSGTVYLYTG